MWNQRNIFILKLFLILALESTNIEGQKNYVSPIYIDNGKYILELDLELDLIWISNREWDLIDKY